MDNDHKIITKSAEETAKIGEELARQLTDGGSGPHILCLYGDLGSGKTTFTQGFARGLGITSRLLSPTFIIVRRYDIPVTGKKLYHIDLYRLQNTEDFTELGLSEIFSDFDAYVVVEWAEKLGDMLPVARRDITFTARHDGSHTLKVGQLTT